MTNFCLPQSSFRMHWIVANIAINSDHLRYVNVSSSIRKSIDCFCYFNVDMHEFRGSESNLMTWFRSTIIEKFSHIQPSAQNAVRFHFL